MEGYRAMEGRKSLCMRMCVRERERDSSDMVEEVGERLRDRGRRKSEMFIYAEIDIVRIESY